MLLTLFLHLWFSLLQVLLLQLYALEPTFPHTLLSFKSHSGQGVVAQAFITSTWETEASLVCSRSYKTGSKAIQKYPVSKNLKSRSYCFIYIIINHQYGDLSSLYLQVFTDLLNSSI